MKHYPYVPGYPKPDYPDCMPESDCCGDKCHHEPCPGMPDPGPAEFVPVPPPIAPLQPVPGCNTQEQMMRVVQKTNECIQKWNYISAHCYEALNRVVGAAVSNDVYYDRDEVHLENGYNTDDECAYHIITIRSVDKCNHPIRIKLKTAYDNTTNANVRQSMQDVSFIENANAVITAVDPAQTGWKGRTFYMGAPIAGTEETEGYVGGFNDHGTLKVFPASVDDLTLRQNCIMDIIGLVTPIITEGEITEQAKTMTTKSSISAIGYRSGNGDKIFFQCSAEADKGMQGITVAKVLKDMGCTTAIITCAGVNSEDVQFSNGMMYMGTLTDVPNGWFMPSNCAYWVVSKRPFDGWRNKFTSEIADLVQRVGGSYNEIMNNKHRIEIVNKLAENNRDRLDVVDKRLEQIDKTLEDHESRITTLEKDLAQEIADRKSEDTRLDGRIDKEITDRTNEITRVDGRIDQEITDRTAADDALGKRIDQEITDRTAADKVLQDNIDAEEAERKHQDSLLHDELDKERTDRAHADADLAEKIQQEADARSAADTKLTNDLAAEATTRKDADVELTNEISSEATARKDADVELTNEISAEVTARTNADTEIRNDLEKVKTGETVIPIYVKKAGDTMSGDLNMQGNSVTNLEEITFNQGIHLAEADGRLNVIQGNDFKTVAGADAVADDEFVTKRQLDAAGGGLVVIDIADIGNITAAEYALIEDAIQENKTCALRNTSLIYYYYGRKSIPSCAETVYEYTFANTYEGANGLFFTTWVEVLKSSGSVSTNIINAQTETPEISITIDGDNITDLLLNNQDMTNDNLSIYGHMIYEINNTTFIPVYVTTGISGLPPTIKTTFDVYGYKYSDGSFTWTKLSKVLS